MKTKVKWRLAATLDELREVASIDRELLAYRKITKALSHRRYIIQNRANARAIGRGL